MYDGVVEGNNEKNEKIRGLEAEIEQLKAQVTKLSGASGFCLQCEASAKVVAALQAQVAMKDERERTAKENNTAKSTT